MKTDFSAADYSFMARALKLARRGWYSTHPNPRVGCVIVRDGEILGEGYHRKAGEPHAERMALADACTSVQGATAYVTLEPCCHHGKTPPCTDGLIEAGIAEVVIAMQDPNPLVAGQGVSQLEAAGIKTRSGLLEAQAVALNRGFVKRMQDSRPRVRCKLACSLDGRTAMQSGESVWISSAQSRRDVQFLRAESSAILTGAGTVLADNPSMNVRLTAAELKLDADLPVCQPVRVILDATLKIPADAKILTLPGDVLIFCDRNLIGTAESYPSGNVRLLGVDNDNGELNLAQVMQQLAQLQINDLLLESGAVLAGSMLQAGLVDELVVYQAPHLMGDSARGLLHLPLDKMSERVSLSLTDRRSVGEDTRYTYSL